MKHFQDGETQTWKKIGIAQCFNNKSIGHCSDLLQSSPFITSIGLKNIAKAHYFFMSASRFIWFLRFCFGQKWTIEKKGEKEGKTEERAWLGNDVQNPRRKTAVDRKPLHEAFPWKSK